MTKMPKVKNGVASVPFDERRKLPFEKGGIVDLAELRGRIHCVRMRCLPATPNPHNAGTALAERFFAPLQR